jgi:hypothetical protein
MPRRRTIPVLLCSLLIRIRRVALESCGASLLAVRCVVPGKWKSPASLPSQCVAAVPCSCYANAVLQCLTYTWPLAGYLLQKEHSLECESSHPLSAPSSKEIFL